MYLRTGRRFVRRAHTSRGKAQYFWCESNGGTVGTVVTAGAPVALAIDNALNTDYSARKTGATVMRIAGSIYAVPLLAPAAGTSGLFVASFVLESSSATAAAMDPTSGTGRQMRQLQNYYWNQPFTAAPAVANIMYETERCVEVRSRRKYRDEQDSLFLTLADQNNLGTQQWRVFFRLRTLIRVP